MGHSGELDCGRGGMVAGQDVGGTRRGRLSVIRDGHAYFIWYLIMGCFLIKSFKIPQLNFGGRNLIISDFSYNL